MLLIDVELNIIICRLFIYVGRSQYNEDAHKRRESTSRRPDALVPGAGQLLEYSSNRF